MTKFAVTIGILVLIAGVGFWVANNRAESPSPKACTLEAKICPDGSAVGRVGPDCEFAPCPVIATTTEAIATSTSPVGSGVSGTVSLGPTCPVERIPPDPACADKPYATAIVVYRAGSKSPLLMGNSGSNGAFSFSLSPDSYTLAVSNGTTLPRCASVNVKIAANTYATTTISCDTGIR